MYCIIICGGGGKTTLSKKYSNLFLDIDDFMWNYENKKRSVILQKYVEDNNIEAISNIYRDTMISNQELRNDPRIILCHHPENAIDLNRKIICICRPTKELHNKNIELRTSVLKNFAKKDWYRLSEYYPYQYNDFYDFNNFIFGCLISIKCQNLQEYN
tara:strand:- start:5 stop:478 length:474 start_codon:yes stop_codon:yes gene_type:complete